MELTNADFQQIFSENPIAQIDPDDIILIFKQSTGKTGGILGQNFINTTDLTNFQWNSTTVYPLDGPVIYAGQWWISLQAGNTGNIPTEGAFWTAENKITAIVAKPWAAGIFESVYSIVTVANTIYRLKGSVSVPFNSQTSPDADATNWEIIGGTGNAFFLGFYADPTALNTAHPTAVDGNYAIVGSTDTIWIWDQDTTAWVDSGTGGAGDMTQAIYDPTNVAADAFSMENMIEGPNNKILTQAERDLINGINPAGTHIYVSSDDTIANDTNDGQANTPLRTFKTAFQNLVNQNFTVHLARGSVFTVDDFPTDLAFGGGSLAASWPTTTLPSALGHGIEDKWNGVTFKSYGTGPSPIFDLRRVGAVGEMAKEAGRTNIYTLTFPRIQGNIPKIYGGMWENDFYLEELFVTPDQPGGDFEPEFADLASLLTHMDANPGTFYLDYADSVNNVYYFHASDSSDPQVSGVEYKTRHWDFLFLRDFGAAGAIDKGTVRLEDIDVIGNAHHNGAVYGENIDLVNVWNIQKARHGFINHGHFERSGTITPEPSPWGGYMFHLFPPVPSATQDGTVLDDCEIIGNPLSAEICAFGYHPQAGALTRKMVFNRCKARNVRGGTFDFQPNWEEIIINGGEFIDNVYFMNNIDTAPNRGVLTGNDLTYITRKSVNTRQFIMASHIERFYNCRFAWDSQNHLQIDGGEAGTELKFENCIIYIDNAIVSQALIRFINGTGSPTVIFKNCLIVNGDDTAIELFQVDSGVGLVADKLVVDDCYFYNIEIGGSSDPATINGTWTAFDASSNTMETGTGANNPFTTNNSDPFLNEWSVARSSAAYGKINLSTRYAPAKVGFPLASDIAGLDTTPPTFTSGPTAQNIAQTDFQIAAQLNEPGTIYAVVVADGAAAPTSTEVKNGTGSGGTGELATDSALDSGSGVVLSLTGLSQLTAYDVYVVGEDDDNNLMLTPTLVEVTTLSGSGEDPDATTWLDALTATPTAAERTAYDELVKELKAGLQWNELASIMIYRTTANLGQNAALKDLKRVADATLNGTMAINAMVGAVGDGVSDFVNLGWDPETDPLFAANSSSMGVMLHAISVAQTADRRMMGARSGSFECNISDDRPNNRIIYRFQGATRIATSESMEPNKLYSVTRNATTIESYTDGLSTGTTGSTANNPLALDHYDGGANGIAALGDDCTFAYTFRGSENINPGLIAAALKNFHYRISMAALDAYFDNGHIPIDALAAGDVAITDGAVVNKFVDRIGSNMADLEYTGNTGQRTGFAGPVFHDEGGGRKYVGFPNLNNITWTHPGGISPAPTGIMTKLEVFAEKVGARSESIHKAGGGGFNIKDNSNGYYQFDRNTSTGARTANGSAVQDYKIHAHVIQFELGGPHWYKNTFANDIFDSGDVLDVSLADYGLGATTNLMHADFYGSWIKYGTFTQTEIEEILAICKALWDTDVLDPLFTDLENLTTEWDNVAKEWFLSIDGGTSEWTPPAGASIRWIEGGNGASRSFTNQNAITQAAHGGSSGDATSFRLARGNYPTLFPNNNGTDLVWIAPFITLVGYGEEVQTAFKRDNIA